MKKAVVSHHKVAHGSVKTYTIGFAWSLALTLGAYLTTVNHLASGWGMILFLAFLAVLQLFVQLFYFLHLGREPKPRWNLTALLFAAMVVVIVVFGSLWIMKNLAYDHHRFNQSDQSIIKDEGYGPSND